MGVVWLCAFPQLKLEKRGRAVSNPVRWHHSTLEIGSGLKGRQWNRSVGESVAIGVGRMSPTLVLLLMFCRTTSGMTVEETRAHVTRVRLNNIGTALDESAAPWTKPLTIDELTELTPSLTLAEF